MTKTLCENEESRQDTKTQPVESFLSIDEMLKHVGEYGLFQKIINFMFCISVFPSMYPMLTTYFASKSPPWKCVSNSTVCTNRNMTFSSKDNSRCDMRRSDWNYVTSLDYSIVTNFDLVCDKQYLVELTTSILFVGFMFGAVILGWFTDNYGRKKVYYVSLTLVISVSFISIFLDNIYAFIVSRFVVGFFLHGTFPQVLLMICELVGDNDRAFCNTTITIAIGCALPLLALKAYFIQNWKTLIMVCTLPYSFVLAFFKFVPESVRYHRVKGQIDEAMLTFRRMAYWNKTKLHPGLTISPVTEDVTNQNSNPLDLFRTMKMARTTLIIGFSALAVSMANFCLLFAAGDISGHMYRDFAIINIVRIPVALINPPLVNYFGRKRTTMIYVLVGSASCIALGITPKVGTLKIVRVVLGVFGIACICGGGLSRRQWELELYPTHIRGKGAGFGQLLNKIGATSSGWIDHDLSKYYSGAAFILIGAINVASLCSQIFLPETKGVNTSDTEKELEKNTNSTGLTEMEIRGQSDPPVMSYTNDVIDENKV